MPAVKAEGFSKTLYVGWGDLDANGHMRNTAYLDKAADVSRATDSSSHA